MKDTPITITHDNKINPKGFSKSLKSQRVLTYPNILADKYVIYGVLSLFGLNQSKRYLDGDILALIGTIKYSDRIMQVGSVPIYMSINPSNELLQIKSEPYPLSQYMKDHKDFFAAYIVQLHDDSDHDVYICTCHHFIILRHQNQSVIIQNYSRYYDYVSWCSFGCELMKTTTKRTGGYVQEHPKYRGIMDDDKLMELCQDIDGLTVEGRHQDCYASITGVVIDAMLISRHYKVSYARMDLRQGLYK